MFILGLYGILTQMLHSLLPYVYLTCSLTFYEAYFREMLVIQYLQVRKDSDFSLNQNLVK